MALTRPQIRSRIGAVLEALSTGSYNLGLSSGFTKAINPFAPEDMPDRSRHLAYGVVVTSSPADEASRLPVGGEFDSVSSVEVVFCFVLRPFSRDADLNLGYAAAVAILDGVADEAWAIEEARIVPTNAGEVERLDGDIAVKMTISFDIYHAF